MANLMKPLVKVLFPNSQLVETQVLEDKDKLMGINKGVITNQNKRIRDLEELNHKISLEVDSTKKEMLNVTQKAEANQKTLADLKHELTKLEQIGSETDKLKLANTQNTNKILKLHTELDIKNKALQEIEQRQKDFLEELAKTTAETEQNIKFIETGAAKLASTITEKDNYIKELELVIENLKKPKTPVPRAARRSTKK